MTKILRKLENYQSIVKMKSKRLLQEKFPFQTVTVKNVKKIIKTFLVNHNKSSGGRIPIQVITHSKFIHKILTDCINDS